MFLKKNRRKKNGREFTYYNIVENRRCHGGKVVQRQVLYLGELNSSQLGEWCKTIEVFDEDASATSQLALFEQDRLPEVADDTHVEIRLCDLQLRRPRQWGACWIALHHWDLLRLDAFFGPRLGTSRKGTRWLSVLKVLVCYRLIDPGSEWRLHRRWFDNSAMGDLLGEGFDIVAKDKLYDCHDRLLAHKKPLFSHLQERWKDLFGARFEVLLYDLTSTYFESEPRDPEGGDKRRFGYSRDKRGDCVQVVLKRLWARLAEIKAMKKLGHDECLMKLGAARKEAGRAWHLVKVEPAAKDQPATSFTYELRKERLSAARRREGRYLLRSNLDPGTYTAAELWRFYIQLIEIEEAFKNIKGDLAVRPVHHQRIDRIEAHIFISFVAYCVHVTMRGRLRAHAPGLTPRELLSKFASMQMIDVHLPTTDGRELVMSRYTQPDSDQKLLLQHLKLELPPQPPPKIASTAGPAM